MNKFKVETHDNSREYFRDIILEENALYITANTSLRDMLVEENSHFNKNKFYVQDYDNFIDSLFPFKVDLLFQNALKRSLRAEAYVLKETLKPEEAGELQEVLEHLEEPDNALVEISRVLKPLGTFIIIVPMHHGYTTDNTHRIFYRPKQLAELAKKFHYDVKSISIFPIPWEFLGELFYFFEYRMIAQKQDQYESREGLYGK